MKKYVNFIFKNSKLLFIIFILINIAAIVGVTQVRLNTDISLFTTNTSDYQTRLDELEATFGATNELVVLIEMDAYTEINKATLRELQVDIATIDHIESIQGPAPEMVMTSTGLVSYDVLTADQLYQMYDSLQEFSPLKTEDGMFYATYSIFVTDDFNRQDVKQLESILVDTDLTHYIAGDMYNQTKIVDYILRILFILPPLAIVIIILIFRWQIGAFKPTLLSVLPAAIASLWTFGIIGYLGNEISILTAIVPIFTIVIGSADGLHFLTHYQKSIKDGLSNEEAMSKTLHVVGIPMIITTLTSMAGFLSLLSMDTSSVVDLAIFAALGIFLAGIATWYVIPLILTRNIAVIPKKEEKFNIPIVDYLKKLWGLPTLIIVLLFIALTVIFTSAIKHEFSLLSIYKPYTEVAQNAEKLEEINGGSIPLYIVVQGNDLLTVDSMNTIDTLTQDLIDANLINHAINPYRMLQILYDNSIGGDITNDVALQLTYTSALNSALPISNMIDDSTEMMRILIFPTDLDNQTLDDIEAIVDASDANASVTGAQYLLKDLNVSIEQMQLISILLAISIVFLMLFISLRDLKLAFLSILPISITVGTIYAVLGMTGISLNITTVIIFSIAIGVGIDYAVHFSNVYKLYSKSMDDEKAVKDAYHDVSKPIIANALGISLGLSVLMLSPLTIHMNVSILMWVGMIVSVFVTLTFLPTILLKWHRKK